MSIKVVNLRDCPSSNEQGYKRVQVFGGHNIQSGKISLEYVVLPKGAESMPHAHLETDTVVFTLQGKVKIYYGEALSEQVVVMPLGCVHIPPGVIHHVVNEHDEDMIAVVARTPHLHQVQEYSHLLKII